MFENCLYLDGIESITINGIKIMPFAFVEHLPFPYTILYSGIFLLETNEFILAIASLRDSISGISYTLYENKDSNDIWKFVRKLIITQYKEFSEFNYSAEHLSDLLKDAVKRKSGKEKQFIPINKFSWESPNLNKNSKEEITMKIILTNIECFSLGRGINAYSFMTAVHYDEQELIYVYIYNPDDNTIIPAYITARELIGHTIYKAYENQNPAVFKYVGRPCTSHDIIPEYAEQHNLKIKSEDFKDVMLKAIEFINSIGDVLYFDEGAPESIKVVEELIQ